MANLDLLLKALDTAIWEMGEGFKGLKDEDVWVRVHPRLLSIGEIAAHVAYGECQWLPTEGVESPLVTGAASYYTSNVEAPFQLNLGAEAVYAEVKRVHEQCKAAFLASPKDSEDSNPAREGLTWGMAMEYQVFHVAYHTGQIYSVRHLMGHETQDN